jgi:hypothetical protein
MIAEIIPKLNPYPLPLSIVIMDNARVHMYQNLVDAIYAVGALIVFPPPFCPHLNPIEFGFSLLKRWIIKNANIVFGQNPELVLKKAITLCADNNFLKKILEYETNRKIHLVFLKNSISQSFRKKEICINCSNIVDMEIPIL